MNERQNGSITIQKKHIVIAVVVIIALLAGGIIVGANWNKWFGNSQSETTVSATGETKPPLELDGSADRYTGERPKDQGGAEEGIKIPGYPSITIAKDTQDVTMALMNPEGNPCYFKFEIVMKDSGEQLFESKYVQPGDCIYDVHLNKPLPEGEYPATIKITTIAMDGETPLNGANVETVLIAQ